MKHGKILRRLRKGRKVSVNQISTDIGISKKHLWEIERGFSPGKFNVISDLFDQLDFRLALINNSTQEIIELNQE